MTLLQRLDRIEQKRTALVARAASRDTAFLSTRPSPNAWSILEIIEHLILAEEDVFGTIDSLATRAAQPQTRGNRARYWLVMGLLRFRIPVQAPSQAMLPTGGQTLQALTKRWTINHAYLRQYVATLDRAGTHRAVFRHPVTGPLTVLQAVWLLEIHLDRHLHQIRSLEKRLSKTDWPAARQGG